MDDQGGLLGFDPEMLAQTQDMLRQMGPSDADRKQAMNMGLLQGGLGLLANVRKPFLMGVGEAGQQGLSAAQQYLQQQQALRMQNVQALASIMPLAMQANQQKMLRGVNWSGTNSPVTSPGDPNAGQTAANMGGASAMTSMYDPAVSDLLNTGQQGYASVAQPTVRSGGANTGNKTIDQAINMGIAPEAIKMMLMTPNGFTELGKTMAEYGKRAPVRPGTVMGGLDPNTGQYKVDFSNPALPQGMQLTADQQARDVPGASEGLFRQSLRSLVAKGMTTPLSTVGPGGGQQVTPGLTESDLFPAGLPNVGQGPPKTAPTTALSNPGGRGGAPLPRSPTMDSQGNSTVGTPVATTGPQSYQTTLGPGEAESDKGFAELGNVRAKDIFERGALGNQQIGRFTELNNLLTKFNPSLAAPWRLELARYAGAAGVDADTQKSIAGGDPSAMIAFNKLGFEGALQLLKSYTPRFTQSEVAQALTNNANIVNRPGFSGDLRV